MNRKTTEAMAGEVQEEQTAQMLALFDPAKPPAEMGNILSSMGIELPAVNRPYVPHFWKVSWDELCTFQTRDPKVKASPIIAVTSVAELPDAPQVFETYVGMIRVEFVTEFGDTLAFTHSRAYAATGEFLPLTEWVKSQAVPFYCRIGYIETRKAERHVVRPLPLDIEVS